MGAGLTPGERIKLYRRRAGLTQEQAAQLKGCTVSAWRKWESGERQVTSLGDWVEIARIVRVRDLYKLTGLPVGQLPDEPAEHESIPIRAAMHEFAPQLDNDAEPDVARLGESIEFAWNTWHGSPNRYSRTGSMLPELVREARATLPALAGDIRREALRAAATLYLLVRAYAKHVGAHDLAMLAGDRAMTAATDADDPHFRAAAAWNAGMVLSTRGHTEEAADLARGAIAALAPILDAGGPERLSVYGSLHLLLAVQEARLNDERRAIEALSTAEGLAGRLGERNDFRMVFGPTNVGIHRASIALEFSRPGEALRVGERVDVSGSPSVERRFSHTMDLARGYALRGEDLGAVHMLLRAEQESPEDARLNLVTRATVRDLLTRETPTTRPELRPLAERLGIAE